MKVIIRLVDGYTITTHSVFWIRQDQKILNAIKLLKKQQKTFYVSFFDHKGKYRSSMWFENGRLTKM